MDVMVHHDITLRENGKVKDGVTKKVGRERILYKTVKVKKGVTDKKDYERILSDDMPIKTRSMVVWILAKLYVEEESITRKSLVKELCQATFDLMENANEFGVVVENLENKGYIYEETKKYEITETGIIVFRREIISPLINAQKNLRKIPERILSMYEIIVQTLKSDGNTALNIAQLCVQNTPLVLDFLIRFSSYFN